MFDLLEEDLSIKTAEPEVVLAPRQPIPKEPIVYAMPEKFRVAPKKTSPALIFALIGGGALLVSGIFLVVIVMSKPVEPPSSPPTPAFSVENSARSEATPPPIANSELLSSSTASTLQTEPGAADLATSTESLAGEGVSSTVPSSLRADAVITSQQIVYEPGIDSDSDMLTDVEERLYGTNPEKPDTDEDGYLDGNEFRSGFDPLKPERSKLDAASYISRYTNEVFGYSLLHPQLWIAKAVPNQTEKEVLISSATGEFISVSAQDNPDKLSVQDWVSTFSKETPVADRLSQLPNSAVVEAASGLEAFAAPIDANGLASSSLILRFKYEPNTKPDLNFVTTFQMLIQSVQFKELSQ